jgi:hypothetical protein
MILDRPLVVRAALAGAGFLAVASAGMAIATPGSPARMSELRLHGSAGYTVLDSQKERVGEVTKIDADRIGRTRYLHISLDAGGEVKVAAFRAFFNAHKREVELMLSQDILSARAGADMETAATEPSVGT